MRRFNGAHRGCSNANFERQTAESLPDFDSRLLEFPTLNDTCGLLEALLRER
jgi:hypothetical protein